MKKLIFFGMLILNVCIAAKAQFAEIKIRNMVVVFPGKDTVLGNENKVILKNKSSKEEVELFNMRDLHITATYKVSTNNGVRRSNLKKSAVNVDVNYTFEYKGKKSKVKTERIFYLDDEQKFQEEQTGVFKEGIKNKLFTIKYECVLE